MNEQHDAHVEAFETFYIVQVTANLKRKPTMTKTSDPTRDEMLAELADTCSYADNYDREAAIYWFASDWHGGQFSNLYAALCAAPYVPGAIENECPDDAAGDCYAALAHAFGVA